MFVVITIFKYPSEFQLNCKQITESVIRNNQFLLLDWTA